MGKCPECDATVWETQPTYLEYIECRECGADASRKPPLWLLWRFYWRKFEKARRLYGLRVILSTPDIRQRIVLHPTTGQPPNKVRPEPPCECGMCQPENIRGFADAI